MSLRLSCILSFVIEPHRLDLLESIGCTDHLFAPLTLKQMFKSDHNMMIQFRTNSFIFISLVHFKHLCEYGFNCALQPCVHKQCIENTGPLLHL